MMAAKILQGVALTLLASCAATGPEQHEATVEGVLISPYTRLTSTPLGDEGRYVEFMTLTANYPAAVMTSAGHVVYLTTVPHRLAQHVTRRVRATGVQTADGRVLAPDTLEVEVDGSWVEASLDKSAR